MADRRPVVEERLPFARSIPVADRHRAALELERRRDTVARLEAVAFERLRVRMRIDEAGCDDQAGDVDGLRAGEWRRAHGGDLTAADADVPDRVEARGRIHHAAAGQHEIEGRRLLHGFASHAGRRCVDDGRQRHERKKRAGEA